MGRSPAMGTRRRSRRTKPEAAKASEEEGTRRRNRRTKPEAAEASSLEVTRRRNRRTKPEAAEAASSKGTRRRNRRTKPEAAEASSEQVNRILKLESEEDREILMKVKSEEGKILKLKKEFMAASEKGLDMYAPAVVPTVKAAGKKTKKVVRKRLVTMTKPQIDFIRAMATHPCPTRNWTEEELAELPKSVQYSKRQDILIRNTRLAYLEALIDQQERFGYAVEESEAEVTDDEDDGTS